MPSHLPSETYIHYHIRQIIDGDRLSIAEYLTGELGPRFEPPALLRQRVADGDLGKKTGRGFYDWTE